MVVGEINMDIIIILMVGKSVKIKCQTGKPLFETGIGEILK